MSRTHSVAPGALAQLPLFDVEAADGRSGQGVSEMVALPIELAAYQEALTRHLGLAPSTAEVQSRHLAAMVKSTGVGSVRALLTDGCLTVDAIRKPHREATRRARHLAVMDYLNLCGSGLEPSIVMATKSAIESLFAGRTTPRPHLVDRQLGGSVKEVRRRPPFGWLDGERLIEAARSGKGRGEPLRDAALLALHVRSGLPSSLVPQLEWQLVRPLMDDGGEMHAYAADIRGRRYELAITSDAVDALRSWWRVLGMPLRGPVFITSRRPPRRLSASQVSDIVRACCLGAGLPAIDRRRLRAPFARWLLNRGWGRRAVADAFGYERVRELDDLIRYLNEALAQVQLNEVLVMTVAEREVSSQTPARLIGLLSADG